MQGVYRECGKREWCQNMPEAVQNMQDWCPKCLRGERRSSPYSPLLSVVFGCRGRENVTDRTDADVSPANAGRERGVQNMPEAVQNMQNWCPKCLRGESRSSPYSPLLSVVFGGSVKSGMKENEKRN